MYIHCRCFAYFILTDQFDDDQVKSGVNLSISTLPAAVVQRILLFDGSVNHRAVCKEWNGHFEQNKMNGDRDYNEERERSVPIVNIGFDDPDVLLHYERLKVQDLENALTQQVGETRDLKRQLAELQEQLATR